MKKYLLFLPLALLFLACKKDAPDIKDEPAVLNYYPTEVTRTSSANSDIITTRYSYNAAKHLIQEIILVNGKKQHSFIYNNTGEGVLVRKRRFNDMDVAVEQDEFERDAAGRITRLNHSYLDWSNNPTLHHYNTYHYSSNGLLAERNEFTPDDQFLKKLTFQQTGPAIEIVKSFRNNNALELTSEAHYDQKHHPLAATGLNTSNFPGNVTFYRLTDESNQDFTTITSAIIYNEAGFPIKVTQTYSDGRVLTDTYTYMQM